ncbi:hypothetical protein [Candidatus Laterigemmans baculatus]|uniref:hypothetical protein n=1 Tax=Candidatus Laterigemmans baculatus TaxID=2770505 RepID=UPI0013DC2D19|nr:hypothetical protein [Candidatus Laterigemmans baculatus]
MKQLDARSLERESRTGGESGATGAWTTQHPIPQLPSNPQQQVAGGVALAAPAASALRTSEAENPLQVMPSARQTTISERKRRGKTGCHMRLS